MTFNKELGECISIFYSKLTRKMRQLSAWIHGSDLNVSDLVIETWQTASLSWGSIIFQTYGSLRGF